MILDTREFRLAEASQQPATIITTKRSKLFDQPSADAALSSRVAIYALQHRYSALVNQDVTSDIEQMPTEGNVEPWSQTYQRFGDILRKNPAALSKMLNHPKFEWLAIKDQKDQSLSTLIETELERLKATINAGEEE